MKRRSGSGVLCGAVGIGGVVIALLALPGCGRDASRGPTSESSTASSAAPVDGAVSKQIGRMRVTATPADSTETVQLAAATAQQAGTFDAETAAGTPVRVTLAEGGQPSAPITLRFDLSGDLELAGTFSDVVKPVVRSISDDDSAATDLLPAEWDPASKTVTTQTTHLSVFQVIATNVADIANAMADAWKKTTGKADSPCREKSQATIGGTDLTLTPSRAGPVAGCLRDGGDGAIGIDFTNGTRQYYGVTSQPAGRFQDPPLMGSDDAIASWLHQNTPEKGGLLAPGNTGALTLPAGTTSATIRLDVDPVLLQLKTIFAGVGMVGLDGDVVLTALMDAKQVWDCLRTAANTPSAVIPGNVTDFRNTLTQLAQCGLFAAGKAVVDPKFVLHRMSVALDLVTTLPDQLLANVTGAIGEVSGDNHLIFILAGQGPTGGQPAQTGAGINRVEVTTWAYDRVEGDTYVADKFGGKKIEVFWKSYIGDEQIRSRCTSTVRIDGPGSSQTKEVKQCSGYNPGTYIDVKSPGVYTVTVTVQQDGQPDISAQRTVTVLPQGSR